MLYETGYAAYIPVHELHGKIPLARLENSHEFLRLDRRHVKRIVFELKPDTMADIAGFREFQHYLIRGRDAHSRAGVALEMEDRGYKLKPTSNVHGKNQSGDSSLLLPSSFPDRPVHEESSSIKASRSLFTGWEAPLQLPSAVVDASRAQLYVVGGKSVHPCSQAESTFYLALNYRPSAVNVVQLARLENSHEFLRLDRRHVKRIVFELKPDTMTDVAGFREFQHYLIRGRDASSRAGVALEMEDRGYKLFILPPGQAAMSLGYHGDLMIAVLRSRW
ncbi:hypothetical protein BBJ28_00020852 [Nothophytophthora sp. Chile5]|nr:hypothetical protein BBJ28_00020852 [Nothophytophthora sp. Chile5]